MILLHDRNRILKSSDTHDEKQKINGIIKSWARDRRKTENKNIWL